MSQGEPREPLLGRGIALVLRVGTFGSIGLLATGYLIGLVDGLDATHRPVIEQIAGGGAAAVIAVALLGLTLVPIAVAAVAAAGFRSAGERGRLRIALLVLVLLIGSLVAAQLLVPRS